MTTAVAASPSDSALKAAREKLDAHVREIVAWHFDPETGCPFWLERAEYLRTLAARYGREADKIKSLS